MLVLQKLMRTLALNVEAQINFIKIWNNLVISCPLVSERNMSLLTLHVIQLLDVVARLSGVHVEPVTVTEMLQDVFGVKG